MSSWGEQVSGLHSWLAQEPRPQGSVGPALIPHDRETPAPSPAVPRHAAANTARLIGTGGRCVLWRWRWSLAVRCSRQPAVGRAGRLGAGPGSKPARSRSSPGERIVIGGVCDVVVYTSYVTNLTCDDATWPRLYRERSFVSHFGNHHRSFPSGV